MFDKDAVIAIQTAEATRAVADSLVSGLITSKAVMFAPEQFKRHDLESVLPLRRRARGVMSTSVIQDFATYTEDHAEPGATVFVDANEMKAQCVLNLGSSENPGQADNLAALALRKTAPFEALLLMADGRSCSQQAMVERIEDWVDFFTFYDENMAELKPAASIAALRNLTIETARKVESQVENLSASASAFEQVKARAVQSIPVFLSFIAEPYVGLPAREFKLRLSVHTSNPVPTLAMTIRNLELAKDEMAAELVELVKDALGATDITVLIGTYTRSN